MSDMFCFFIGVCWGLLVGWGLCDRFRPAEITVEAKIDQQLIMAWLSKQGLVVMPKGTDFKWPKEKQ